MVLEAPPLGPSPPEAEAAATAAAAPADVGGGGSDDDDKGGGESTPVVRRGVGLFLYCARVVIPHPLEAGRLVSAEIPEPQRFKKHRGKARKGWEWQQQQQQKNGAS